MTDTLTSQVEVTATATKLVSAAPQGQQVIVTNRDATNPVFIGGPTVTTVTGVEVKPAEKLAQGPFELPPETVLYAICGNGKTARVDVFTVVGD